jgi:hypothetical protein
VMLVCGDTIFSTPLLEGIAGLPPPCQYQMCRAHSVFLLSQDGVRTYRDYAQNHRRRWKDFMVRPGIIRGYPDGGLGTHRLKRLHITHYGPHNGPIGAWYDIDGPGSYEEARVMIADGRLA